MDKFIKNENHDIKMALFDRINLFRKKLTPEEKRLRDLIDREFAYSRRLRRLLLHEYFLRLKKRKLERIRDEKAPPPRKFNQMATIINDEIKLVNALTDQLVDIVRLGRNINDVLRVIYFRDQLLIEGAKATKTSLREKIKTAQDIQAIKLYKEIFQITLREERIGEQEFQDQASELRTENIIQKILAHLLTNLQKQKSTIEAMKTYRETNAYDPVCNYEANDQNLFNLMSDLVSEEEKFFHLIIRDERALEELEAQIKKLAEKGKLVSSARKNRLRGLASLAVKGSLVAAAILEILKLLEAPPPGKSRVEIIQEIERRLNADLYNVIEETPEFFKRRIESSARSQEKKPPQGFLEELQEKTLNQLLEKTGFDTGALHLIDSMVEEWTEHIYQETKKEWGSLKYEFEQKSGIRVKVELNEKEVRDAIRKTLVMMKPTLLKAVRPKSISEWIAITGGSPRWTGEMEQKMRKDYWDKAEPLIDELKNHIRIRLKALLIPDILKQFDPELRGKDYRSIYRPEYIKYLIWFVFGSITLEFLLRKTPIINRFLIVKSIALGLRGVNAFTKGVIMDIYEIVSGRKRPF